MKEIYLDNSATTRICDEALNKYIEASKECYGNPSSLHALGFESEKMLNSAREAICNSLMAKGCTVIFTASGTEANNLAIIGRAMSKERYKKGAKIVTTMGEHASVDAPLDLLSGMGYKVARIPTKNGEVDMAALEKELTGDVILVSMMMVNNETGALYDTAAVGKLVKAKCPDAFLHIDATQSYLKIPFTKAKCGADMITLSSHKIEGPKGVGALYIRKGIKIENFMEGGAQESGKRAGTENTANIVGLGAAISLACANIEEKNKKLTIKRNRIISELLKIERSHLNGDAVKRLSNNINISFEGIEGESLLLFLDMVGICASSGSACTSGSLDPSHVLLAIGRPHEIAHGSLRLSIDESITDEEIDYVIEKVNEIVLKLRKMSPLWERITKQKNS